MSQAETLWICHCRPSLARLETNGDLVHLSQDRRCLDCGATMAQMFPSEGEAVGEAVSECGPCRLQIVWNREAFWEEAQRRARREVHGGPE